MSLYYNERAALALALRRHVNNAPASEYDDDMKKYLVDLINKFRDHGYAVIVHGNDKFQQEAFDELLRHALE